jgi:hypothetical protein
VNRFVIFGFGVLALVGVYSIVVGRPPFYSSLVASDYPPYTPPSPYTAPTPDTPYSEPASPYGTDPLNLSGVTPPAAAPPSDYAPQDYAQTAPPQENIEIWPEQALPANGETQIYTFDEAIAPFKIQSSSSSMRTPAPPS